MASYRVLAVIVLVLATSATGRALPPTMVFARLDVTSFAGARSIVTGDFDRDGWIDIAHANVGRNSVTVLLNQGGGASGFTRTIDVPVGPGPFDVTAGDFNQDGFLDLAVTHGSGQSIAILRGRATGGFTRTDINVAAGPRGIASTDFDKDGKLDLIVTGWDSNTVQILRGNGSGGFTSGSVLSSVASRPQGVAAADFNRDGHLDLVVAHESGNGLGLLTGSAGAIVLSRSIAGMANLNVLTVQDFNRDGWPDVAAASSSGSRVGLYFGGSSGLRFHRSYATGASPRGIAARDLNHDGLLDLITANRDGDSVSVLLGDAAAPGTFEPADAFAAGAGSRAVVAEDFDRDGRIDLATGNQDAASVTVLWNDHPFDRAAFTFDRLSLGTSSNEVGGSRPLPADFNEDGKLDVVVKPGYLVGPFVHVLLTDGPVVPLRYQQFSGGGGYQVADLNRDGHMDVMLIEASENNNVLLLPYFGDGRGGFTPGPQTTIVSSNRVLSVGDLNSDAIADIVLVNFDQALQTYFIQVLIGRGDGRFVNGSRVNTSDFTSAVTLADISRDGKIDVVAFVHGTLTIFPGDGAGNLALGTATHLSNAFLQELELGDLNRDGFLDAVAGEQSRVTVALGRGNGFDAPTMIPLEGFSNNRPWRSPTSTSTGPSTSSAARATSCAGTATARSGWKKDSTWDGFDLAVVDFTRDGLPDILTPTSMARST